MKKRPRLKDIAGLTGVSTNTVSLALMHSPLVAQRTAEAIWAAARQLNYRPNHLARSLVSRRSHTVGLILTNIQNPILTGAAQVIQSMLARRGYATLLATSNGSLEEEESAIDVFFGRQVDGMLIYPANHSELGHIEELRHHDTPVVLLSGDGFAGIETVSSDARAGARKAVAHLVGLGHQRIGLIDNSALLGKAGKADKAAGYEEALIDAGLAVDRDLIVDPGGSDAGHGYDAMPVLLSRGQAPTAVLAANDTLALGAMHWCFDNGLAVPEDLSIVGFDNIALSAHVRPALTTVNYAADDLSRRAVERLLTLISGGESASAVPVAEFVEPELVVRASTGPARGGRSRRGTHARST